MPAQVLYGNNVPKAAPSRRTVDMRSLVYGAAGQEPWYPVYQFSGYNTRWEQPQHNPFLHVPPYF